MRPLRPQDALAALRKERGARFWRWVMPYLRLLGGSLPGILFTGLVLLLLYNRIVAGLPDSFPAAVVAAIILTIAMRTVWVRTYLAEADLVYLMPVESRIGSYLRACMPGAVAVQLLKISFLWALLWQLYRIDPIASDRGFLLIWLLLLAIKLLGMYGWWMENRIIDTGVRRGFAVIRTGYLLILVYAALAWEPAYACLMIGGLSIVYLLLLLVPRKFVVAWERLIALERKRRAQWIRLLQQFVEVESEPASARPSPFARAAGWFPYEPRMAYRYAYFLIWSRSPISRISATLLAVGAIIIVIVDALWLQGAVLIGVAVALRLQLKELERYQEHNDWSFAIPRHADRKPSARTVARLIWSCSIIAMLLVLAVRLWLY